MAPEEAEITKDKERTRKEKPKLLGRYQCTRYLLGDIQCRRYLLGGMQCWRYLLGGIESWRYSFGRIESWRYFLAVSIVGGTFLAEEVTPKYGVIFSAVM